MAKRWNGKKMSHGSKNLERPARTVRVPKVATKKPNKKTLEKQGVA